MALGRWYPIWIREQIACLLAICLGNLLLNICSQDRLRTFLCQGWPKELKIIMRNGFVSPSTIRSLKMAQWRCVGNRQRQPYWGQRTSQKLCLCGSWMAMNIRVEFLCSRTWRFDRGWYGGQADMLVWMPSKYTSLGIHMNRRLSEWTWLLLVSPAGELAVKTMSSEL